MAAPFARRTLAQIELARVLAGLTPNGLSHFIYSSSGSEANDTVVRLVRHYWATRGKRMKRERIVEHVREVAAPHFFQKLRDLADRHPLIGEVRGVGLMAALQLVRDKHKRVPFDAKEDRR